MYGLYQQARLLSRLFVIVPTNIIKAVSTFVFSRPAPIAFFKYNHSHRLPIHLLSLLPIPQRLVALSFRSAVLTTLACKVVNEPLFHCPGMGGGVVDLVPVGGDVSSGPTHWSVMLS